ncbi:NADH:flavin oxidoreductase [Parasphingorhabdus sp. JC815]|uniref:NADH:flavin oxidoreductase n=1 Tax=Parasphingorhabdus sp. JC815 TaxID=3232140 RepID=UPI0034584C05
MSEISKSPFDPITIGPLKLRNRFIKAATNEGMAKGGLVSKGLSLFHERMAEGGAALSTVAYCATSRDGRTFADQVTMERDSLTDMKAMTDAVHRHGGAISAQLTHAGSFTFLPKSELQTSKPLSSSGGFNKVGVLSNRFFKQAMNQSQMEAIAEEFVAAACLAREAGFDAVELHMGHGYLLSQFVSPVYNKRKDAYGGTIARRMKFPSEVLSRVLDAVGKDLAVLVKYSMTDGAKGGNTIADGIEIAKYLQSTGAHMAVLSNGLNVESIEAMFGSSLPKSSTKPANLLIAVGMWLQSLNAPPEVQFHENYLRENALKIREAVDLPLAYIGGAASAQGVDQIISDEFDAIAMGRALIHDPQIINRWKNGANETSGCTACNRCVTMMYLPTGTHCVLTGAQDAKLNTIPAGASS